MSLKPKRRVSAQNRTNSKSQSVSDQDSLLTSNMEGVYVNPHLTHSLTSLIGCIVHVHLQSGIVYEGILKAISPHMDIALQIANAKNKPLSKENIEHLMELKFSDVVTISATSIRNHSLTTNDNIFKTDVEISRSNGVNMERELERFTDFVESGEQSLKFNLDDNSSRSQGWSVDEMFSVNKEKFKVESSYDEEMSQYTTKLDRSETDEYKQREVRAAKLASEIETKDKFDSCTEDVGTEEEMFSSVVRNESVPTPSHQKDVQSKTSEEFLPASITPHPSDGDKKSNHRVNAPFPDCNILSVSDQPFKCVTMPENEQVEEALNDSIDHASNEEMTLGVDKCSGVDKNELQCTPAEDSESQTVSTVEINSDSEVSAKEEYIRNFKLDPTAKEFNPMSSSSAVVDTMPVTSPSSSLTVISSSVMVSPTTYQFSGSGKKLKGGYRHKPHTQGYQSQLTSPSTSGSGYIISQSPPGMPGMVRPLQQVPHLAGQVLYTNVPQYNSFLTSQPGIITPQVVTSPKFEVNAQHQVIGQQVSHVALNQQTSLLTQQGQHHMLPGVSPQVMSSPQSIFASPHHAQMMTAIQDNLGSTTSVVSGPQRFDTIAMPNTGPGVVHAVQHQVGQQYTSGTAMTTQNKVLFPQPYNINVGK